MKTFCSRLVVVYLVFSLIFSPKAFTQNHYKAELHFANDAYQLTPEHERYLDSFFTSLRNIPPAYQFRLTGHTDSVGTSQYNQSLSYKRAASVAAFLRSKGFRQSQMQLKGKGFTAPVAANSSEENKEMNRRVEIDLELALPNMKAISGIENALEKMTVTDKGGVLVTSTGTRIAIPAGAFVDANGNEVTGKVDVSYTEYRDPVDFLLSDIPMHFDTPDGMVPFNSAGMFTVDASQNNTPVYLKDGKAIDVGFSYNSSIPNLNFYRLDATSNSWQQLQTIAPAVTTTMYYNECMAVPETPCGGCQDFKTVYMVYNGLRYAQAEDSTIYKFAEKRRLSALQSYSVAKRKQYWRKAEHMLRRFVTDIERKGLLGKKHLKIYQVRGKNDISSKMLDDVYFTSANSKTIDEVPYMGFEDMVIERSGEGYNLTFIMGKKKTQVKGVQINPENKAGKFDAAAWVAEFKSLCIAYKEQAALYRDTANIYDAEVKTYQAAIDDLYFDTWVVSESTLKCFREIQQPYMSEIENILSFDEWLQYFAQHKADKLQFFRAEQAKPSFAAAERNARASRDAMRTITTALTTAIGNFSLPTLGTYNCDQLWRFESPVNIYVNYKAPNGEALEPVTIYLLDSKLNGLLTFYAGGNRNAQQLTFNSNSTSRLILFDAKGNMHVVKQEAFASVEPGKTNRNYTFTAYPVKIKNKQELKEALRL